MEAVLFFENNELDTWKRLNEGLQTRRSMICFTELGNSKYLFPYLVRMVPKEHSTLNTLTKPNEFYLPHGNVCTDSELRIKYLLLLKTEKMLNGWSLGGNVSSNC